MTTRIHSQARPTQAFPGQTLGIVGFVLAFVIQPVGLIISVVALFISYRRGTWNTFAIAGIVTSIAMFALGWMIFFGIATLITTVPPIGVLGTQ